VSGRLGVIGGSAAVIDRADAVNAAKDELRELQRSDLSVLAAYRQIPILTGRLTAAEDLQRLQALPPRETHLALVKEHYTNIRANVWFHGLDARSRGRVMVAAELPLLYPLGRSKEAPEIKYPTAEEGATVAARHRAGKVSDHPFLETLAAYRYLGAGHPVARR
jgi:hypothetical protein